MRSLFNGGRVAEFIEIAFIGSVNAYREFAPDTRERHEWLTGCPLAHPVMANACVLWRREQLIGGLSRQRIASHEQRGIVG